MIPQAMKQALTAPSTARLAHAATLNADGSPRRSAIGALADWDGRHLLLGGLGTAELGNLGRNPTIELAVLDPHGSGGWHLRGFAVVLTAGELHRRALARLGAPAETTVALMQVDRIRRRPDSGPANDCDPPVRAA